LVAVPRVIHGLSPNGLRYLGPGAQTSRDPVHYHLPGDSHLSLKLEVQGALRPVDRADLAEQIGEVIAEAFAGHEPSRKVTKTVK